ncbi:GNAT family N-acetyltransferase [Methylosinus sp. H3A]|uniref:GNAT family N-acetyltransferase n=1 Tax=Methylosinus sp. H3A TaxID=2785786 RepID=UPI0018C31CF9|nr:GNAT family N-acetyltransferase [Methylosinus sp. H3A]MBG0808267.1 GNAT family N-acetyltransferase [Methylosinus sp. H3A]
MTDRFLYTSPLDPRAAPLLDDLVREYDARYGDFFGPEGGTGEVNRYPPEAFAPPEGNFLLLLRGEETIVGGAFRRYDETTAEFKRIWTRSDLRRQGLARVLVQELEAQALRQGYARIFLTTGCRQPEAANLYLTSGYRALFDLAADLEALRILPFEKHLAPTRQSAVRPNGNLVAGS